MEAKKTTPIHIHRTIPTTGKERCPPPPPRNLSEKTRKLGLFSPTLPLKPFPFSPVCFAENERPLSHLTSPHLTCERVVCCGRSAREVTLVQRPATTTPCSFASSSSSRRVASLLFLPLSSLPPTPPRLLPGSAWRIRSPSRSSGSPHRPLAAPSQVRARADPCRLPLPFFPLDVADSCCRSGGRAPRRWE